MKRQRGRGRKPGGGGGGGGGHHQPNRNFESNGPDVKVRGSAAHVYEKYMQLARDAQSGGDRVLAESYMQHAEHYYRVMKAMQPAYTPPAFDQRFGMDGDDFDDGDDSVEAGMPASGNEPASAEGAEPADAAEGERRRFRDRDREREDRPPRGPRADGAPQGQPRPPRDPAQAGADDDGEGFRGRRRRSRGRYRPGGAEGGFVAEGQDQPREERPAREEGFEPRPARRERVLEQSAVEGFGDAAPAFLQGE